MSPHNYLPQALADMTPIQEKRSAASGVLKAYVYSANGTQRGALLALASATARSGVRPPATRRLTSS